MLPARPRKARLVGLDYTPAMCQVAAEKDRAAG